MLGHEYTADPPSFPYCRRPTDLLFGLKVLSGCVAAAAHWEGQQTVVFGMPCLVDIVPNLVPVPGEGIDVPGWCCRPTDALHGADAVSFQGVQQPQLPEKLPEKPKPSW